MMVKGKKGLTVWPLEKLGSWIIALAVLALVAAGIYLISTGKLAFAVEKITEFLRFR